MPLLLDNSQLWLTNSQIANAILFHLKDEKWFNPIPPEVEEWLKKQLIHVKKISFKAEKWKESQTGTHRMLWLLVASKIDPFGLCKFAKNEVNTKVMHRRFSDIISTWGIGPDDNQ